MKVSGKNFAFLNHNFLTKFYDKFSTAENLRQATTPSFFCPLAMTSLPVNQIESKFF